MSHELVEPDEIQVSESARELVGERYGANVSLIIVDTPPGQGPGLHRHPYEEVFVVHSGEADFTVGDEVVRAGPGQVVIVHAGTPHGFKSVGPENARMVNIHTSPTFVTEWL
jgi:quercetin dioxygenase-like cupin family protein